MDTKLSRRSGIIAGLVGVIAVISGRTKGEEYSNAFSATTSDFRLAPQKHNTVTFDLGYYKEYTFNLGTETITLTPAQVMAALKGDAP